MKSDKTTPKEFRPAHPEKMRLLFEDWNGRTTIRRQYQNPQIKITAIIKNGSVIDIRYWEYYKVGAIVADGVRYDNLTKGFKNICFSKSISFIEARGKEWGGEEEFGDDFEDNCTNYEGDFGFPEENSPEDGFGEPPTSYKQENSQPNSTFYEPEDYKAIHRMLRSFYEELYGTGDFIKEYSAIQRDDKKKEEEKKLEEDAQNEMSAFWDSLGKYKQWVEKRIYIYFIMFFFFLSMGFTGLYAAKVTAISAAVIVILWRQIFLNFAKTVTNKCNAFHARFESTETEIQKVLKKNTEEIGDIKSDFNVCMILIVIPRLIWVFTR